MGGAAHVEAGERFAVYAGARASGGMGAAIISNDVGCERAACEGLADSVINGAGLAIVIAVGVAEAPGIARVVAGVGMAGAAQVEAAHGLAISGARSGCGLGTTVICGAVADNIANHIGLGDRESSRPVVAGVVGIAAPTSAARGRAGIGIIGVGYREPGGTYQRARTGGPRRAGIYR